MTTMRGHFEPQVWDVRIDVGSILEINIGSSVAFGSIKQIIFLESIDRELKHVENQSKID